jgi:hypothetical protein
MMYSANSLRVALKAAENTGTIKCRQTEGLRCPAVGYQLYNGWCCNLADCKRGKDKLCIHRLDIQFTDGSYPVVLDVKYRASQDSRDGFIPKKHSQLRVLIEDKKVISENDLIPI